MFLILIMKGKLHDSIARDHPNSSLMTKRRSGRSRHDDGILVHNEPRVEDGFASHNRAEGSEQDLSFGREEVEEEEEDNVEEDLDHAQFIQNKLNQVTKTLLFVTLKL